MELLSNRRLLTKKETKPYDSEIEYLEADGNQFLEIPISISRATDAIELTYKIKDDAGGMRFLITCTDYNDITLMGGFDNVVCYYAQNNGKLGLWTTTWANIYNIAVGEFKDTIKIDYKAKRYYIDGFTGNATGNNTKASTGNLYIFLATQNPRPKGKIFGCRIWRNNELISDCVPVRKKNVGYLWDKVNQCLYENKGSGAFELGADTGNIGKYTIVDYITSNNSGAYIDTGFIANQDTKIWFDMQLAGFVTQQSSKWPTLFGSRTNTTTNVILLDYPDTDAEVNYIRGRFGTNTELIPTNVVFNNERVIGEFSKNRITINGNTFNSEQEVADFTCPGNLYLFSFSSPTGGVHPTPTSASRFQGLCFGFKIWDGETLVRDFVPVRNSHNEYGLYDLVNDKFYCSSSSTGEFEGGNGYEYNNNGDKCYFYRGLIWSTTSIGSGDALISTPIHISSNVVMLKKDTNYSTMIIERNGEEVIKCGQHNVIGEQNGFELIELSSECDNVLIQLLVNPVKDYIPNFKLLEYEV